MTRCTSRWKNIIVVDEDKKEICQFELDQSGKIKDNIVRHSKKISLFMKEVSLKHDIKKKDGCYQFIPKNLNLKFTGNIEIFSLNNDECESSVIFKEIMKENLDISSNLEINANTTYNEGSDHNFFDMMKFDSDQDLQINENDIDKVQSFYK